MEAYMPYVVSIVCALISGITSYSIARKQAKSDLKQLEKKYELDIEQEREKHRLEIEKLEMEHKYNLELQQKQFENQMGGDVMNMLFSEVVKMPEVRKQFSQGINSSMRKNKDV
jgi:hypothetical protein